jgi:hypothetical protein
MSIVSVLKSISPFGLQEQDMNNRDTLVATISLALSTLAMAGVIGTGAYTEPAGVEARGVHALSNAVAHAVCVDPVPAALAAATESGR